ncbi:tetratricopeptide repeat protein [Halalkalibacter lacteus]|uniref:tetratricopeptide repeat protein n=1 Tax=Halalkalibacter lacteus TaxID=3090663 RepID=UPI002FC76750
MHPTEWTLIKNKEHITLQAQKLTLFQQCKVVECTGSNDLQYLLFFYKDHFLTVQPLIEFKPTSFLGHIEKHGYDIHAPNPLFSRLLPPLSTVKIRTINHLLATIKKDYSLEETALIFSYFDSYMSAEKLETSLKEFFFTYRRNGKLMAAYRLAKILLARGYNQSWIIATTEHLDYANAAIHFEAPLSTLLSSDPIYVEQLSFFDLRTNYNLLVTLYDQQNRMNDSIIIHTTKWLNQPTALSYPKFVQEITKHFEEDEVLLFLRSFLTYVSPKSGLHQDVYQRLIRKQDYKNALNLLFTHSFSLSNTETNEFSDILEHNSLSHLDLSLTVISERLIPLLSKQPIKLDKILRSALPQLLKHHSLPDIHKWLQQIQFHTELPVMKKINNMFKLMDDPDNQLELGFHYFDLNQYEKAIECFSWEMELHPNQIEPIKWLAKTYRKIGKHEEVETYHNLLSQIQRSS